MEDPPASNPTRLGMTFGPFSSTELKPYMTRFSSKPPPQFDEPFVFYHPDLGPTNILVSDDGDSLAAIIDWEAAAYFPRFWVATKCQQGPLRLEPTTDTDINGWAKLLVRTLEMKGFHSLDPVYRKWNRAQPGKLTRSR